MNLAQDPSGVILTLLFLSLILGLSVTARPTLTSSKVGILHVIFALGMLIVGYVLIAFFNK